MRQCDYLHSPPGTSPIPREAYERLACSGSESAGAVRSTRVAHSCQRLTAWADQPRLVPLAPCEKEGSCDDVRHVIGVTTAGGKENA